MIKHCYILTSPERNKKDEIIMMKITVGMQSIHSKYQH